MIRIESGIVQWPRLLFRKFWRGSEIAFFVDFAEPGRYAEHEETMLIRRGPQIRLRWKLWNEWRKQWQQCLQWQWHFRPLRKER